MSTPAAVAALAGFHAAAHYPYKRHSKDVIKFYYYNSLYSNMHTSHLQSAVARHVGDATKNANAFANALVCRFGCACMSVCRRTQKIANNYKL